MVRAPGRVNLIGEHTDYSDLPVLPIAIGQSLFVAAGPAKGDGIEARSREFPDDDGWRRYVDGAATELRKHGFDGGAQLFVAADLPSSGGLSSSAALTCGVLAAVSAVAGEHPTRDAILAMAIPAEHSIGIENGGMDHEAILFGRAGNASRIDFVPHARRLVPVPAALRFVVADSGERAAKGGAEMAAYNERVAGTREAARLLGRPLREVRDAAQLDALPADLRRLARHVVTEANRVDAAEQALATDDLAVFGGLLDASHASLRDDFAVSTAALDRLCAAMRSAGAFGARLTGAGFGGYALAACTPNRVASVIDAAIGATGGPAFEVKALDGLEWL
jgi:galactokinase